MEVKGREGPRPRGRSRRERTSRVVGLAGAASLEPALLAHGQATTLADLGVAARALAYGRPLGWGHRDAGVNFVQLLVDAALPLVIPPIGVLALCPVGGYAYAFPVSSAWEEGGEETGTDEQYRVVLHAEHA